MKPDLAKARQAGFGLIELMLAMMLGLIVSAGAIVIFVAQRQVYSNASSQALIQNADNALSAIITPVIRGAGFLGCGALGGTSATAYVANPRTPLTYDTSSAVQGYEASIVPPQIITGANNDTTASHWTPSLDASFASSGVSQGSDVLVLIGAQSDASPVGVTAFNTGSLSVNDISTLPAAPQMIAVSDCSKNAIFMATAINSGSNTVSFTTGPNGALIFASGSQLVPIQQTALFIAKGDGSQNALWQGIMTGNPSSASWDMAEVIPGVSNMQVRYGIGNAGQATRYVNASQVPSLGGWGAVTSIKLGFLIEGNLGSAQIPNGPMNYTLFDKTFSVPADSRLRHTFFMTVNTRNTTL
ncbi:PilW family protein [Dyella japonica]|uniref:Type IV pilus assembly protein PilW n=1 Tax=Dyella japonica TaxID=231455 RepID=A0ABV2K158_9GAMM